jgi:hypothetical protein
MVSDAREEEFLFLDFKTSASGGVRPLDKDRRTLAKALSGFGNAAGGVLVWGVSAPQREPRKPAQLADPDGFRRYLEEQTSRAVTPAPDGVLHAAIPDASTPGRGFVLTLVPQFDGLPVQVVGECVYYRRVGDSFLPMAHHELADRFGLRPQPRVEFACALAAGGWTMGGGVRISRSLYLTYVIRNVGRGIARYPGARISIEPRLPGRSHASWGIGLQRQPYAESEGEPPTSLYASDSGRVVYPGTELQVDRRSFEVEEKDGLLDGFTLTYAVYCDGSQASGKREFSRGELEAIRSSA